MDMKTVTLIKNGKLFTVLLIFFPGLNTASKKIVTACRILMVDL